MAIVRDVNSATGAALSVVDVLSADTLGDIISVCPAAPDFEVEQVSDDEDSDDSDEEDVDEEETVSAAAPPRPEEVVAVVSKHAAPGDDVEMQTSLASLALDSLEMMAIVREVNAAMGSELSVVDVLGASSMEDLARLATESAMKKRSCVLSEEGGSATLPGASRVERVAASAAPGNDKYSSKARAASSGSKKLAQQQKVAPVASHQDEPWAPARDLDDGSCDLESGGGGTKGGALSTAKPLKEPSLAYRFYFTVLCHLVGTQILLWGFAPVSWVEQGLPLRFKLQAKLAVLDAYHGHRTTEWLELLLPRCQEPYPGVPDGFLRPWERDGYRIAFAPTLGFKAAFCLEFCFILVFYHFLWSLGCHLSILVVKWLVVGKQRAGVFPIWESAAGWRSALFLTAHSASFYSSGPCWTIGFPARLLSAYARLLGAKVGKRVSWSGGLCVPDYGGFDLLDIGNDVVFDSGSRVNPIMLTSTCVVTHGHIKIGNRARVGLVGEVRHGAHLGDDSVVCAGAGAVGFVPPGAYALSAHVIKRPSLTEPPPAGAVDTKIRVPGAGQHLVYDCVPILSYLIGVPLCLFCAICTAAACWYRIEGPRVQTVLVVLTSASLVPMMGALTARFVRLVCYGPRGAKSLGSEVRLTPGFVLAHRMVHGWTALGDGVCSMLYLYSGGMNYVWRLLGMRVDSEGVILSEILSNHGLMDLLEVGRDTYIAARTAISCADVDARRCVVRLKPIKVGKSCFIGPLTVLMPGSTVDDHAATGSCAVIGERTHCSAGRIAIGDGERTLTLAWKPKPYDAFKGYEKCWAAYSTVAFYSLSVIIRLCSIGPSWMILLSGLELARDAEWAPRATAQHATDVRHLLSPTLKLWVAVMDTAQWALFVLVLFTVALHCVIPFRALLHVVVKRALLGTVEDDGAAYPLRGRVHQAWCAVMRFGRMPALPKSVRFLFEYVNAYLLLLGATIGPNSRIYPEPEVSQAYPEADCVHYGDNVQFSAHMYGHDFNMLHLKFKTTSAGDGVKALDAWQTQVLPGCHLPNNTTFHNVGRSVVFSGLIVEPDQVWTGNPVRRIEC